MFRTNILFRVRLRVLYVDIGAYFCLFLSLSHTHTHTHTLCSTSNIQVATAIYRAVSHADERAEESQKRIVKLREDILRTAMKAPKSEHHEETSSSKLDKTNNKTTSNAPKEKEDEEPATIQSDGPHVRELLETSQNDEEGDEVFAAVTKAIRFGDIDPLCEMQLKIGRRCDALQQENTLLRSVIENMKSSVGQFKSRLKHAVSPRLEEKQQQQQQHMTQPRRRRPPPPPRTAPRPDQQRRQPPRTAPPAQTSTPSSFAELSRQRRGSMIRKNARWAKKLSHRLGPERARMHQHVMNRFSRTSVKASPAPPHRRRLRRDEVDYHHTRTSSKTVSSRTQKKYGFPSSF